MNKDVCAIFVTYNPDLDEFTENLQSVIHQVGHICIVDNSTNESLQQGIINLSKRFNNKAIINGENIGIASAQNKGFKWAIENGYEAFLLLDQDSKLKEDTVSGLIQSYHSLIKQGFKVACVGPLAYNRDKTEEDVYHIPTSEEQDVIEVQETLSSGSLISKQTLTEVGYMEESLFIDLVDYEWCWRAKLKGYSTYIANKVKVAHRLGDDRHKILGINIGIPSPMRHYYQFRNTIKMLFRSYVPFNFKRRYIILLPIKFFFYPIFAGKGLLRLKMIIKGLIHGIKGVDGKGI